MSKYVTFETEPDGDLFRLPVNELGFDCHQDRIKRSQQVVVGECSTCPPGNLRTGALVDGRCRECRTGMPRPCHEMDHDWTEVVDGVWTCPQCKSAATTHHHKEGGSGDPEVDVEGPVRIDDDDEAIHVVNSIALWAMQAVKDSQGDGFDPDSVTGDDYSLKAMALNHALRMIGKTGDYATVI